VSPEEEAVYVFDGLGKRWFIPFVVSLSNLNGMNQRFPWRMHLMNAVHWTSIKVQCKTGPS